MSAAHVRAIKPAKDLLPAKVVERLERAREMTFQAHSIAAVAAAAAVSEMPADEHCTETTLAFVAKMLDDVATLIAIDSLERIAGGDEVPHGE